MSCFGRPSIVSVALVLCIAGVSVGAAPAEESKSAAAAKELVQALAAAKLEAIATTDAANPGVFVAALYMPGTLLVVSAKYSAPPLLVDRINAKDYQAVYVDLQSASVRGSKVFIMDQGADGLAAKPSGDSSAADSFDEGDKSVSFDGDWKKAKISEADYTKAFAAADDRYAKMLSMLVSQAKKAKGGS
jgi:hypothetical protein